MKKSTFKGGVHPFDGKDLTKDKEIIDLNITTTHVYPVSQHIGAPAAVCVKVQDKVLVGDILAKASSFVSANVCSSVSGTVTAIEKRPTVGGEAECVVVESDAKYTLSPEFGEKSEFNSLTKEEIRSRIRRAGLVGLGGAGFPVDVKLTPKDDEKIEYVIVNGCECEPYLTGDYRLMIEQSDKLILGLEIILKLFPNAAGIIAVEDNKPDAIKLLSTLTAGKPNISVCALKTKYPQGAERNLIYAVTKRKINSSMLPADAGCIVSNVSTVISVEEAVIENLPLTHRVITVTGEGAKTTANIRVRTGAKLSDILDYAGGVTPDTVKIISGGPMMGVALNNTDIPVIKTSGSILCLTEQQAHEYEPSECIRCGRCAEACPENLLPPIMLNYSDKGNYDEFARRYGLECVECGCCSFVCPAKRPVAAKMKEAKNKTKAAIAKKKEAENGK